MRWWLIIPGLTLAMAWSASSAAETPDPSAFDRPMAISSYALGWGGTYDAAGVGGRFELEFPKQHLGLDLYMDALVVDWPGAFRHDHPIGFSLYAPIVLAPRVRIRALLGACAVFSFIEPSSSTPASDDVLFGVHTGAGVEVIVYGPLTWFLDLQTIWYIGHDRPASWSGAVSGALTSTIVFQPSTGVALHFGR